MSTESLIAASGGSIHEHRKATRKMRWWYESLADYMLAHPTATQGEIALHFKRAVSTISTIVNTDAFKAYLRSRRAEYHETLNEAVKSRLLNVAERSLDAILDKLEKKRDTLPLEQLNRTTENALKALGFGPQSGPAVVVNNSPTTNNTLIPVAISLEDLDAARTALRNSQQVALPPVVDVTPNASEASGNNSSPCGPDVEDLA